MTTLNNLIADIVKNINDQTVNDLIEYGFDKEHAVKLVTEFDEFDLVADSLANPVSEF